MLNVDQLFEEIKISHILSYWFDVKYFLKINVFWNKNFSVELRSPKEYANICEDWKLCNYIKTIHKRPNTVSNFSSKSSWKLKVVDLCFHLKVIAYAWKQSCRRKHLPKKNNDPILFDKFHVLSNQIGLGIVQSKISQWLVLPNCKLIFFFAFDFVWVYMARSWVEF